MAIGVTNDFFHIVADLAHAASFVILLWAFYQNRSAEGVSILTQYLYLIVFATRYVDLFWTRSLWLFGFKIYFLSASIGTVFLMLRAFPRTRERDTAWKLAAYSLLACLVTAPFTMMILKDRTKGEWTLFEFLYDFSLELESICILPQLLLLRQTSVPTVIDSYYLLALGSYRALYLIVWIIRGAQGHYVDPAQVIFGVIQTLLYLDFAWVYYSRQRVKLRGGGVVDADDLSKSYLVRRLIGTRSQNPEEDEIHEDGPLERQENRTTRFPGQGRYWGKRGISISADEDLPEHEASGATEMRDPSHFENDDDDDEDEEGVNASSTNTEHHKSAVQPQHDGDIGSSARQWSDD